MGCSMRRPVLATLLCAASAAPVSSQMDRRSDVPIPDRELRIQGVVVDAEGRPVAGARVVLDQDRRVETDREGGFAFQHVAAGGHDITAVTDGCEVAAGPFELVAGRDARLRLVVREQEPGWEPPPDALVVGVGTNDLRAMEGWSLVRVVESLAPALEQRSRQTRFAGGDAGGRPTVLFGPGEPVLLFDGMVVRRDANRLLQSVQARDAARVEVIRLPDGSAPEAPALVIRVDTRTAEENTRACGAPGR